MRTWGDGRDLGVGAAQREWAHDLGKLLAQARKTQKIQARRLAAIDGLELAAHSVAALPTEWRGTATYLHERLAFANPQTCCGY